MPFPSSPEPLFQNEGRCSAFDMEIIFHSHANKTHFHKKGCAPSLLLKVRVFGTRKWPVGLKWLQERLIHSLACRDVFTDTQKNVSALKCQKLTVCIPVCKLREMAFL